MQTFLFIDGSRFLLLFRYEGSCPLVCATNNGLESNNGQIKKDWLDHRREKLSVFLQLVELKLREFSEASADKGFSLVPHPADSLWRTAVEELDKEKYDVCDVGNCPQGRSRWLVAEAGKPHMLRPSEYIAWFDNPSMFTSFEEYQRLILRDWFVVSMTENNFATCTCKTGLKEYRCIHSLCVEIFVGIAAVPQTVLPIRGPRRGRQIGRPPTVKGGYGTR